MEFLNHSDHDHPVSHSQLKRKRSPSNDIANSQHQHQSHAQLHHHHPSQTNKPTKPASPAPSNQHLTINYLARASPDDLPLVTNDDGLHSMLRLLSDYHKVLDRNESLACNLGAPSLGPILIKRFERMFDAPPRVIVNHGAEGTQITWLDVAEFARLKPDQFTLERNSMGQQTCQFWTKQCQVQISSDDYVLISSGMPQRMIPPQPIVQDEENELGTLEILERNLNGIIGLADKVAAKARQLNHRMKSRKQAILDRRASDAEISYTAANAANVGSHNLQNGSSATNSPLGFVAVNSRQHVDSHAELSRTGASQATHNDLMNKFFTIGERNGKHMASNTTIDESRRPPCTTTQSNTPLHSTRPSLAHLQSMHSQHTSSNHIDFPPLTDSFAPSQAAAHAAALSALGIPASLAGLPSLQQQTQPSHVHTPQPPTPSSAAAAPLFTPSTNHHTPPVKDEGPFKSQMVQRMEQLKKGDIVYPPCDRCRRLHMDCLKNLTACAGCTKKHAKCSWREVTESELMNGLPAMNASTPTMEDNAGVGSMVDPQLKDRSKVSGDVTHLGSYNELPSIHSYAPERASSLAHNGRSLSYGRPISSRSSSGNGHGGGFDPQILNADTSTPNGHHSGIQSPLDPITAASLAAAAQAVSSRDGSESNDRRARDQRDKMGMGVGAVVA